MPRYTRWRTAGLIAFGVPAMILWMVPLGAMVAGTAIVRTGRLLAAR